MTQKPNILIIYADQMRYDCMGCSGNPDVKTPHLNRLAQEGVMFDNAFTSYPLCTPFRASFLTGKYAHEAGIYSNHFPIPTDQPSLAPIMKEKGYKTGYIGKWHLYGGPMPGFVPPGPDRMGFDHFVGYNRGHRYMDAIYFRDTDQPYHCKRFEPDFQTDHAIEFMEEVTSAPGDDPFLAYLCLGPPHYPMDMPEYWKTMYDPDRITLPTGTPDPDQQRERTKGLVDEDFGGEAKHVERSKIDNALKPDADTESEAGIRKFVAEYYGMISNVDYNVGRLLNWLDHNGLADNTLVLFFSDHGDMLGQHGGYCGNKRQAYRASAQVPVLMRYSGKFPAGKRVQSMIDLAVDTMPTFLDLCGAEIPEGTSGVSYLSLLAGMDDKPVRDHVRFEYMKAEFGPPGTRHALPQRGIRTPEWLYVRKKDRAIYLYDEVNDPEELINLVDDPDHAAIQAELDRRVASNMAATGDDYDLMMNFPPPGYLTHDEVHEHLEKDILPRAIEVP